MTRNFFFSIVLIPYERRERDELLLNSWVVHILTLGVGKENPKTYLH